MKNSLWKRDDSILRVLDEREGRFLVIECRSTAMPRWISRDEMREYIANNLDNDIIRDGL